MIILFLFSILAGLATACSPCILPILPIMLASSVSRSKLYPLGLIAGLLATFTLATLFLAKIIQSLGISDQILRGISSIILLGMAALMLVPKLQEIWDRFSSLIPQPQHTSTRNGFIGGALVGVTLGLVWTPCAGPILASVTTLVVSQGISLTLIMMLLGFCFGIAIPLLGIAYGGAFAISSLPALKRSTQKIRFGFGLLTAITAILIFFNLHTTAAAALGQLIPQRFTEKLEHLEQSSVVTKALQNLEGQTPNAQKVNISADSEYPVAPEVQGISNWINSNPLTLQSLRGKVVLIDFWTYSCVNCLRTLPYVNRWYDTYKDQGLVVIGVHAPEFAFEHDFANVQQAVTRYGITYPVALDNDFATWHAFKNQYWPAHYFIDANGKIRHQHFGEGGYEESENIIRKLLSEANHHEVVDPKEQVSSPSPSTSEIVTSDFGGSKDGQTPETYLGTQRRARFSVSSDSNAASPTLHNGVLSKEFKNTPEYIESTGTNSTLVFHVKTKKLFLVAQSATPADVLVSISTPNSTQRSEHSVTVKESKLYEIANLPEFCEATITLTFLSPHIQAFAFTFSGS